MYKFAADSQGLQDVQICKIGGQASTQPSIVEVPAEMLRMSAEINAHDHSVCANL